MPGAAPSLPERCAPLARHAPICHSFSLRRVTRCFLHYSIFSRVAVDFHSFSLAFQFDFTRFPLVFTRFRIRFRIRSVCLCLYGVGLTPCPAVPMILVGTQVDLREDEKTLKDLAKLSKEPITPEQGKQKARQIKASRAEKSVEITEKCA